MLTIQGLSYAYSDRFLFKNLSFDLNPGELIQLKGRNGSGKNYFDQSFMRNFKKL